MDEKKAFEPERKKALTMFEPISKTSIKAGDVVNHATLGKGIVIGFSSISNNPDIFFYGEQSIICVDISSITLLNI